MFIYMLGWRWKHKPDFIIERPNGINGMQIILVQSKACICMGNKKYNVDKNTVFVVESCFPHCIYAVGEEYADDWIRFNIEENDKEFMKCLGIKYNVPIKLDTDTVSTLISVCEKIFNSDKADKNEALRHLMSAIFLQINSCCITKRKQTLTYYDIEIEKIREQIYNDPSADWNISNLAKKLNVSVPHFQRLYKTCRGVPCTKDILTSRMEYAKQLLLDTDLSANDIAGKCGYQDYSYFSRAFSKYACVSPAQYRKNKK